VGPRAQARLLFSLLTQLASQVLELVKDGAFQKIIGEQDSSGQILASLLDQSIRLKVFGDLHEYGALGRVVHQAGGAEGDLTGPRNGLCRPRSHRRYGKALKKSCIDGGQLAAHDQRKQHFPTILHGSDR
jgi:hypothetical protein